MAIIERPPFGEYFDRIKEIEAEYGEDLPDALDTAIDFINEPSRDKLKSLTLAILYAQPNTELNRQYIEEVRNGG